MSRPARLSRSWRAFIAGSTLLLCAGAADAQVITGTLTDSASGQPVPGALISATHGTTQRYSTVLSDPQGGYVLRLSEAGTYLVSVRRIGLRPSTARTVQLGQGERVILDLQLARIAVALAPVGIRESSVCGEQAGGTQASRQLLGEFLLALQSLTASAQQTYLTARVASYVQYLDPSSQVVQAETTQVSQGSYRTPFTSLSAADLAASGFVRVLPNGEILYLAPDPTVLASPEFIGRHCFKAVALPGEPSVAGLSIEPLPGIRTPDIEGVARFDAETRELKSLTFRFVNPPPQAGQFPASGFVEFARTSAGTWWVNAWHITAPVHQASRTGRRIRSVRAIFRGGGYVHAEGLPVRSSTLQLSLAGAGPNDSSFAVLSGSGQVARQLDGPGLTFQNVTPGKYRVVSARATGSGRRGALAFDTLNVTAGATTDATIALSDSAYGSRSRLCGNGRRAESRGAVALVLFNESPDRALRDRDVLLLGERQTRMSLEGYRLETFRKPARSDAAGVVWWCDREDNEEITLSGGLEPGAARNVIGRILPGAVLIGQVFMSGRDATDTLSGRR